MNDENEQISVEAVDDKDQKLALFQEITHLDDFDQCSAILESTNWDVDQAIQAFFGGTFNNHSLSTTTTTITTAINSFEPDLSHYEPIEPTVIPLKPSSRRLLTFKIEYLDSKFTLHVPDNETVLKLKELIEEKINLPAKFIKLNGWRDKNLFVMDKMTLNELNLPLETHLYVKNTSDMETDAVAQTSSSQSNGNSSPAEFEVHVKIINPNASQLTIVNQSSASFGFTETTVSSNEDKYFRLNFDPSNKFIDIRRSIFKLTNILANSQEWFYFKGDSIEDLKQVNTLAAFQRFLEADKIFSVSLNSLVEDTAPLSQIKTILDDLNQAIDLPTSMKNSKLTPSASNSVRLGFIVTVKDSENHFDALKKIEHMESIPHEDLGEYEDEHMGNEDDLEDNFLTEESISKKQKPLIPSDCQVGDEVACTNAFVEEFSARYGPITPLFFIGKLDDAIKEALLCSAKDRKLLGIYLHSDHTVFHNIFCSKTLCDENVVNFLSSNFVVWPWDFTLKQNEQYFNEKCSKYLGSVFTSSLRSMRDKMPLFLVVTRVRGSNEVAAIIEGDCTNEMMITRLMQTYEMFEMQRIKDESDEKTRDERERIKREQDAAYHASLEFDKAKRQRQAEEHERIKQEAEQEAENERRKVEEINNRKIVALKNLPNEPSDDVEVSKTSRIRFRLPSGELVQRKFFISNKLKSLIDFMTSQGYFVEEYKLLSSWPRKDLTNENQEKTLEELKLFPQETLTLEQR